MSGVGQGALAAAIDSFLGRGKDQDRPAIPTIFDAQVEAAATNIGREVANLNMSKASLLMPTSQNTGFSGSLIA